MSGRRCSGITEGSARKRAGTRPRSCRTLAPRAGAGQWRAGTGCAEHVATYANRGGALLCLLTFISTADAQTVASNAAGQAAGAQAAAPAQAAPVACASTPGQRTECPADTSRGVVLLRSMGEAPCLLGRTWGYDQTSVWVSDGCSAEFATGAVADAKHDQAQGPNAHSERRLPARRRREGPDLFPAVQLRPVSEPAEPGRVLRRRLRQHEGDSAAPGHPAAEVLRAVLGVVPHAEDALLPLRLVVERVAGRSGAGRRCRQPDLDLQPVRERGRRHHVAAHRAKHRGSVPVLARRRRPPDRRRVLPRLVHLRRLAQRRVQHQGQVPGDVRQQPEHARRERSADRQQDGHAVLLGRVDADDRRVRPVEHVRRLRRSPEARDAARRALLPQPRGKAKPAGHRRHREQPDPAVGRQHHLHAGSLWTRHHGQRS